MTHPHPPRPRGAAEWAIALLATVQVVGATVLWTATSALVIALPAFLAIRLATGWRTDRVTRLMIWLYGRVWMALVFPSVRVRTRGFSGLSSALPCVAVMNHHSFFDTFFMALLPFSDVCFAVRAWPFRMPWYAAFMRMAGYLNVESDPWEKTMGKARKTLGRGACVFFFPEGHRSRTGRMGRFRSGAFKMAVETGLPVLPLVIEGTGRLLPPGTFWVRPARVTVTALPLLSPAGLTHKGLCDRAFRAMEAAREHSGTPLSLPADAGDLLPHAPPMRVVDRLLEKGPDQAVGEATLPADGLFRLPGGAGVEPALMIEMMAQTFAMGQGFEDRRAGRRPPEGYLVGVREARFSGTARAGDRLLIRVRREAQVGDFFIAAGEVSRGETVLAEGSLKFWVPGEGGREETAP